MKRRVLVAEEDDDLREIIVTFIEAKGWSVTLLGNVIDLDDARRELAIAVLDVRSFATPPFKVFEDLRGKDPQVPVIVIASFGDAFVAKRARNLGAACVLEKPFDLEELDRALVECCGTLQVDPVL